MNSPTAPGITVARDRRASAVVWIGHEHASVVTTIAGRRTVTEIDRDLDSEPEYLGRVARATKDSDRVLIVGDGRDRLAFEREYVSIYRRPDRLLDIA